MLHHSISNPRLGFKVAPLSHANRTGAGLSADGGRGTDPDVRHQADIDQTPRGCYCICHERQTIPDHQYQRRSEIRSGPLTGRDRT